MDYFSSLSRHLAPLPFTLCSMRSALPSQPGTGFLFLPSQLPRFSASHLLHFRPPQQAVFSFLIFSASPLLNLLGLFCFILFDFRFEIDYTVL
jgi:hypothetical protein